jgi:hypothetical protein
MTWKYRLGLVARIMLLGGAAAVIPGLSARHVNRIACRGSDSAIFLLEAQAVPTATQVPCFDQLPVGWTYGESEFRSGLVRVFLDSDRAGDRAVELTMTRTCDVSRATRVVVPAGPIGVQRYDQHRFVGARETVSFFRFEGGCVTYRFSFTRDSAPSIFTQADRFLGFTPRQVYVDGLRQDEGLTLCGADAPPCPG